MKKLLLLLSLVCSYGFSMHINNSTINADAELDHEEMMEHAKMMGKLYFYQKNEMRNKRQEARKKEHLKRKKQQAVKQDQKS